MTVRPEILALIIGCALVTLLPRIIPFLLANKVRLPAPVLAWLAYIPAAVISALFFNEMLITDGTLRAPDSPHVIAGLVALAVAFASRNIYLTIMGGMATFALEQWLATGQELAMLVP